MDDFHWMDDFRDSPNPEKGFVADKRLIEVLSKVIDAIARNGNELKVVALKAWDPETGEHIPGAEYEIYEVDGETSTLRFRFREQKDKRGVFSIDADGLPKTIRFEDLLKDLLSSWKGKVFIMAPAAYRVILNHLYPETRFQ